jgi:3-oxoacyl-[acyl-carrier protein] reductase
MSQLANQIAVVTGAGSGIGRAIALKFAAAGADIVCVSRTIGERGESRGGSPRPGAQGLGARGRCGRCFRRGGGGGKILAEAGKVDILVNNAGVTRDGLLMRMSDADWEAVLNTNLKGAFLFTQAFSRAFLKQRSGRIINISSVIGLIGNAGQCNYAASKAGLLGLTKAVAKEFASRGVTVNALAPGFIETDMTAVLSAEMKTELLKRIPLNTLGRPEDVAEGALFLAGPARATSPARCWPLTAGWSCEMCRKCDSGLTLLATSGIDSIKKNNGVKRWLKNL